MHVRYLGAAVLGCLFALSHGWAQAEDAPFYVRSVTDGPWSSKTTWNVGRAPRAGDKVYIAPDHEVTYDVDSTDVIRSLHLDGTLRFATDRSTRLETGLIRVGAGGAVDEQGFDCPTTGHILGSAKATSVTPRAALLVGEPNRPVDADVQALIRLHYVEGMDKQSCPAIVCCGGRMEFHGAPLARPWTKLGAIAGAGSAKIELADDPAGWRVGDQVIVTATTRQNKIKKTFRTSTRDSSQTESRRIANIDGKQLTFDNPLDFEHTAVDDYRADVADLSRNVVIESAAPDGVRGHTMYHDGSTGSISYAEFRHLGKDGTLGRYNLHFHLAGDSMRGASVVGASFWDSHNRWITVHATNYLVVRDCVGYQSRGHGFFLEAGTEVYNVFDRNLAVQAYTTKPLPNQVLPYDKNDGSGFWWANCFNAFTRNTAAECDEYGYFFQVVKTDAFNPVLSVRQPDGSKRPTDVRTLPFVRFEDNEAHCQRRHSFNLGGGAPFGPPNVGGIGPDVAHPLVIRNLKLWNVHWGIHPVSPSVMLDGLNIHDAEYGVWRPEYKDHVYRGLRFDGVPDKHFYAFTSTNRPPNDETKFPQPLSPIDDHPPATVVTSVRRDGDRWLVRGTTIDDGGVARVSVNGVAAKSVEKNFAQWEVELPATSGQGTVEITASAADAAGNQELTPHRLTAAP